MSIHRSFIMSTTLGTSHRMNRSAFEESYIIALIFNANHQIFKFSFSHIVYFDNITKSSSIKFDEAFSLLCCKVYFISQLGVRIYACLFALLGILLFLIRREIIFMAF